MVVHTWCNNAEIFGVFYESFRHHNPNAVLELVTSDKTIAPKDVVVIDENSLPRLNYELWFKLTSPIDSVRRNDTRVLCVDSDTVITGPLDTMYETGIRSRSGLDGLGTNNNKIWVYWDEVCRILGTDLTVFDYNDDHTDAALFTIDPSHANRLEHGAKVLTELTAKFDFRRGMTRIQDQFLFTILLTGVWSKASDYKAYPYKFSKFLEKYRPKKRWPSIVHYCATSHKPDYVRYFRETRPWIT